MDSGPPTPGTVPLDATGGIAADILCVQCGYNLRTLAPDAACPECGTPVAQTLERRDSEWPDAMRQGVGSLLLATCAWWLGLALVVLGGLGRWQALQIGGTVAWLMAAGLAPVGAWRVTRPWPDPPGSETIPSARRLCRGLLLLTLLVLLVLLLVLLGDQTDLFRPRELLPARLIWTALILLAGVWLLLLWHLRAVARRLGEPGLAWFALAMLLCLLAGVGVSALCLPPIADPVQAWLSGIDPWLAGAWAGLARTGLGLLGWLWLLLGAEWTMLLWTFSYRLRRDG